MPRKTYYKPNRSAPRYFKPCDVARAAYNCHVDNSIDRIEIIRCVVKGLGFEFVALPGKERELPKVIETKVDRVLSLAQSIQKTTAIIRRALLELEKSLDFILKFVPDFVIDDEKTVEDKLLKKVLKPLKAVGRRSLFFFKALDTLRDAVDEWENDLKAFILNVGEAARIVKTAKELYSAEVFFSEKEIENCKCKRPRGVFIFQVEFNVLGDSSIYSYYKLISGENGSFIEMDDYLVAAAGGGDGSDYWQVTPDIFAIVRANEGEQRAIQAFNTNLVSHIIEL